ncbi:unnamed protein product [Heterosigma akashiwo]
MKGFVRLIARASFFAFFFFFGFSISSSSSNPVLIIGGNFTLNSVQANLAHFDLATQTWSDATEPRLYLYGATTGVVLDVIVHQGNPYDDLYVVGAFDTTCKTCQAQYCSIGHWEGDDFFLS